METQFSSRDKNKIQKCIRKKYKKVAKTPDGLFKYPTGRAGLETLRYNSEVIKSLPESVISSFCGVGNPFTVGPEKRGETVLDIGCGCGVDAIFAAKMTDPTGNVAGIDLIPELLQWARENLVLSNLNNVISKEACAENLPFRDKNFDVVITNGAFNLVLDKAKALSEVFRVLKPGGRLMIADNILIGELPEEKKKIINSWFQWEGGAIPGKNFLEMIQQAGFGNIELVGKTGFNSSPKTEGVLIRAKKALIKFGHIEIYWL